MKTLLVLMTVLSFGANAQAASKSEVRALLEEIDTGLSYYEHSRETLAIVQGKLVEALRAMRGAAITDPQACRDFTYGEYRKDGMSNSAAMDKSAAFCEAMIDYGTTLSVIQFFYAELQRDAYSKSISLQISLDLGRRVTEESIPCVRSAADRYRGDGFSARTCLQKAVDYCI